MGEMLDDGETISAGVLGATVPSIEAGRQEAVAVGVTFSFPCKNEVIAEDVLKLIQGRPFTVAFDACITFVAGYCFDLPCLHVD